MSRASSSSWRVLIAGDKEDVCGQLSDLMKKQGYEPLEAKDSATAMTIMSQGLVDLALVDVRLPGIQGSQVLQQSQKLAPGGVPIVLVTDLNNIGAALEAVQIASQGQAQGRLGREAHEIHGPSLPPLPSAAGGEGRDRSGLDDEGADQAGKMEAIGRLAGGVVHDLNNLLTVITGYSDMLLKRLGSADPLHSNVEEIHKAADRAVCLTRQLLAFIRKKTPATLSLDLAEIVRHMDNMLQRLIGHSINLVTVHQPGPGCVKAAQGQIEQIIMNLVLNARDAMSQGGRLTIETANVVLDNSCKRWDMPVQPGSYIMLAVSDTGCGMDAEIQSHLFEPYFTTKEAGQGTGLGLSVVRNIVQQLGGSIRVVSQPAQGTTVRIYLPRAAPAPARAPHCSRARSSGGGETILLVEDDQAVRKLVREILRRDGYTVLEAQTAEQALLTWERHHGPIDLLVTDLMLRHINGQELALRMMQVCPNMKVIYMSGHPANVVDDTDSARGDIPFLQKPFTAEALTNKVREVLDAAYPPRR